MADEAIKKTHKVRQAGRKADKKKAKTPHVQELTDKQKNPKAFGYNSINKTRDKFMRAQDIKSKKHHIPVVDRTPLEPPPIVVAVLGGPKCGKSTLIRCLIKNYCKQKLSDIEGPVTIIAGKKRRITFFEVNNDINSMIDIAKIADVVLLLIDATFGIEMEIFEFLEICKAHGSPRIMGILNHLDLMKNNKALRKKKKELKQRFQVELYPGAKLFYLTGLLHDGYLKTEVKNLSRFISVMKFRPLQFRSSHPYLLADRIEDITNPELIRQNVKCDRKVVLYGYVRGIPFDSSQSVHIPGVGDYRIDNLSMLHDPCPFPDVLKKRSLNSKERLMYAPMSGVAGVVYDKDAVYIDLDGPRNRRKRKLSDDEEEDEPAEESEAQVIPEENVLEPLLKLQKTTDQKQEDSEFRLFSNSNQSNSYNDNDSDDEDDEDEPLVDRNNIDFESVEDESGVVRRRVIFNTELPEGFDDKDSESDSDDDQDFADSEDETEEVQDGDDTMRAEMFIEASKTYKSSFLYQLRQMTYGDLVEDNEDKNGEEIADGLFQSKHKPKFTHNEMFVLSGVESFRSVAVRMDHLSTNEIKESIKDCFTTGEWDASEDAQKLLKMDEENEDLFGDFEDMETGKSFESAQKSDEKETKEGHQKRKQDEDEKTEEEKRMEKKMKIKEMFDSEYDDKGAGEHFETLKTEMSQQAQLNQDIFKDLDEEARAQYEGYRAGVYVRMEFNSMPAEFIVNFDSSYPVIVGGLTANEQCQRYVKVRIKVHRWYPKILKNRDPLVLSLGWRRFQTMMFYAKREDDFRLRSLKYAKKYLHVEALFWGPATQTSSGFVALQKVTGRVPNFRIAANGVVLENDESKNKITKKLKLVGHPSKIYQKTAFVKNMFHSDMEVAKFLGAKVQTQSGLRGIIKKSVGYDGQFRVTFEDSIKMSDIVFMKTWAEVEVLKFYSCLRNLLLPGEKKANWQGMRTVAQIKKDGNIRAEVNPDHLYTEVTERRVHVNQPVNVPKSLQAMLPYGSKPKFQPKQTKIKRVVVVKDPEEVKVDMFMKKLKTMVIDQTRKDSVARAQKLVKYKKTVAISEKERLQREKKRKSEICRINTLKNKSNNKRS